MDQSVVKIDTRKTNSRLPGIPKGGQLPRFDGSGRQRNRSDGNPILARFQAFESRANQWIVLTSAPCSPGAPNNIDNLIDGYAFVTPD